MIPTESRPAQDRRYPPQVLREYALIADGERGALIGLGGPCRRCGIWWEPGTRATPTP